MKPQGDYHPPEGWVKFSTLKEGAKFHDIMNGQPVQFIKVSMAHCDPYNAVDLRHGSHWAFDNDEFVYPVDAGWVAELNCYGFQITPELEAKGHQAVIAHVMARTEGRKANDRWRREIEKYLPQLGVMSFSGPERIIRWLMERVEVKGDDAALAKKLKAIQDSEGPEDKKARERLEAIFPGLRGEIKDEPGDSTGSGEQG